MSDIYTFSWQRMVMSLCSHCHDYRTSYNSSTVPISQIQMGEQMFDCPFPLCNYCCAFHFQLMTHMERFRRRWFPEACDASSQAAKLRSDPELKHTFYNSWIDVDTIWPSAFKPQQPVASNLKTDSVEDVADQMDGMESNGYCEEGMEIITTISCIRCDLHWVPLPMFSTAFLFRDIAAIIVSVHIASSVLLYMKTHTRLSRMPPCTAETKLLCSWTQWTLQSSEIYCRTLRRHPTLLRTTWRTSPTCKGCRLPHRPS